MPRDYSDRAYSSAELAEYQDGAIVSTTLLKQEKGTVTAFAFDLDQALSEHSVPHDALLHVIAGTAEVTISGVAHRLAAGELILLPANEPHAVRAVERFKMMLTMIRS